MGATGLVETLGATKGASLKAPIGAGGAEGWEGTVLGIVEITGTGELEMGPGTGMEGFGMAGGVYDCCCWGYWLYCVCCCGWFEYN